MHRERGNIYDLNLMLGDMDRFYSKVGPLRIVFAWEESYEKVGGTLKQWFLEEEGRVEEFHIGFVISSSMFNEFMKQHPLNPKIKTWAWEGLLLVLDKNCCVWICKHLMTPKKILVSKFPDPLFRFLNPLCASYWELQTGYLLYHLILNELEKLLIKTRALAVHAAGLVNRDESAVLICARGGTGKTTTAAFLVSKMSWRIIGDDFVIVDKDGSVYATHLPAHLYSYHEPIIKQLHLEDKGFFKSTGDKLHWSIYSALSKTKAVRRISWPNDITASKGKLKTCIIAQVVKGQKYPEIQELDSEQAAKLVVDETLAEIDHMLPLERAWPIKILHSAFNHAFCFRVSIGIKHKDILPRIIQEIILDRGRTE